MPVSSCVSMLLVAGWALASALGLLLAVALVEERRLRAAGSVVLASASGFAILWGAGAI